MCQSSVYVGGTDVYTIQHIITVSVDEKCVRVQCTLVTRMFTMKHIISGVPDLLNKQIKYRFPSIILNLKILLIDFSF